MANYQDIPGRTDAEKGFNFITQEAKKIDISVAVEPRTIDGEYYAFFRKGREEERMELGTEYLEDLVGTKEIQKDILHRIRDVVELLNKRYEAFNEELKMCILKYLKSMDEVKPLEFIGEKPIASDLDCSIDLLRRNVRYLGQKGLAEVKWFMNNNFEARINSQGIDYLTKSAAISLPRLSISCAPMGNDTCNQGDLIVEQFLDKNIFLDIPYAAEYNKREEVLLEMVRVAKLNPVIARGKLTSNAIICKVCRLIQTCKYGIADVSFGSHSVTYELGLMHGYGKKVCILLQEEKGSDKFTDIRGLDHVGYKGEKEFKIKLAEWLKENVLESDIKALDDLIKVQRTELKDRGDVVFPSISLKKTSIDDFEIQIERSKEYSKSRLDIIKSQINKSRHFFISATPITLKDDIVDTGDKETQEILLHPSYKRHAGWNMDFVDHQSYIKPIFEGLEKKLDSWTLRLFRNGHIEFQALVNYVFSHAQNEEEFKSSPRFNPCVIIEFPVSFTRLLKEFMQKKKLHGAYLLKIAYLNCGNYKLSPYSQKQWGFYTTSNFREVNLDNWIYERVFEDLDMASDKEAFLLIERLYNTFGHSKDKIPFFNEKVIFEIKK